MKPRARQQPSQCVSILKTSRLNIRIPEDLKRTVKTLAKETGSSESMQAAQMLRIGKLVIQSCGTDNLRLLGEQFPKNSPVPALPECPGPIQVVQMSDGFVAAVKLHALKTHRNFPLMCDQMLALYQTVVGITGADELSYVATWLTRPAVKSTPRPARFTAAEAPTACQLLGVSVAELRRRSSRVRKPRKAAQP